MAFRTTTNVTGSGVSLARASTIGRTATEDLAFDDGDQIAFDDGTLIDWDGAVGRPQPVDLSSWRTTVVTGDSVFARETIITGVATGIPDGAVEWGTLAMSWGGDGFEIIWQ